MGLSTLWAALKEHSRVSSEGVPLIPEWGLHIGARVGFARVGQSGSCRLGSECQSHNAVRVVLAGRGQSVGHTVGSEWFQPIGARVAVNGHWLANFIQN